VLRSPTLQVLRIVTLIGLLECFEVVEPTGADQSR